MLSGKNSAEYSVLDFDHFHYHMHYTSIMLQYLDRILLGLMRSHLQYFAVIMEFSSATGGKCVAYNVNLLMKLCDHLFCGIPCCWLDKYVKVFLLLCTLPVGTLKETSIVRVGVCTTAYIHLSVLTVQGLRCMNPCGQHVRLFLAFVRYNQRPGQQSALVEQS